MEFVECTTEMRKECKYVLGKMGCHSSIHHEYFPERAYKTGIEKKFRELDENKIRLPRCMHDELHATTPEPEKPSRYDMLAAIAFAKTVAINRGKEV